MSKLLANSRMNDLRLPTLLGSAALLALVAAAPTASAQGAPDQLRYLDPPQPQAWTDSAKLTQDKRPLIRNAYARVHIKKHVAHQ